MYISYKYYEYTSYNLISHLKTSSIHKNVFINYYWDTNLYSKSKHSYTVHDTQLVDIT